MLSNENFTFSVTPGNSYQGGSLLGFRQSLDISFNIDQFNSDHCIASCTDDNIEIETHNESNSNCLPIAIVNTISNKLGLQVLSNKVEQTFTSLFNGNTLTTVQISVDTYYSDNCKYIFHWTTTYW